jgi:tetratricopeptide (TPR) repeat protein
LADHPEMGEAYAYRGILRKNRGDLAGCVADLSQAIEHGDGRATVFFNRAVALDGLGRYEEALADCTRAIAVDPKHANAYNSRGIVQIRLDRLDEASSDFGMAIRLMPDWSLPYVHRAQLAMLRADWRAAVADYGAAIEKIEVSNNPEDNPLLAKLYWSRGNARRELGDAAGGDADQRIALEKDPTLKPG